MKKNLILLPVATSILFLCGCASNTIVMTPPIQRATVPSAPASVYNISEAQVSVGSYAVLPNDWNNRKMFTDRFSRLAEERYPALFKNTPGAIPIAVGIRINEDIRQGPALLTFICTLGIFGGILPSLPWETDWHIQMNAESGRGAYPPVSVQSVHRGWWSLLSPFGLMTIPGNSDIPAVSTVMTGGPGQVPPQLCDYVMECMVDLLAAELLGQTPQSHSVQIPDQVLFSSPGQTPLTLPLPSESAAPF